MKKIALWIALAAVGVIAAAAALAWFTPAGQFALALWRTPSAAEGALRTLLNGGGLQLLEQSHESWATVSLTGVDAPSIGVGPARVLAATKLQVDTRYDNETAGGALAFRVTSGGIPMLSVSLALLGDTLAVQSPELLGRTALLQVGRPDGPGTTLGRRLQGMMGGPNGTLAAGVLAVRLFQSVPVGSFAMEQRTVELLGKPRVCTAITLRLQGEALADAGLAALRSAAGDTQLRQSLSGWSPALAAAMEQAERDPDTLRRYLSKCALTATALRQGLTLIGWEIQWQQPDGGFAASVVAYAQDPQMDLRVSWSRNGAAVFDASMLRTVGEGGRLTLVTQLRTDGWEVVLDDQRDAQGGGASRDTGTFILTLPGGAGQAQGDLESTISYGSAVEVEVPQWDEMNSRAIGNDSASVRALLDGMGERLKGLLASMGLVKR